MSLPPINPNKSASGISVDPKTLDRVVAPTKRPDGSLRKELKIRPGFTPQEDVAVFRTSRQAAIDARKGQRIVPGWAPPEEPVTKPKPKPKPLGGGGAASSKASKDKQPKKKDEKAATKKKPTPPEVVKDSWEDEEEPQAGDVTGKVKAEERVDDTTRDSIQDAVDEVDSLAKKLEATEV